MYGKKDLEIPLFELNIKTIMTILSDLGVDKVEDKIKIWAIFGGIPKYYELLESLRITNFKEFVDLFYVKNFKSLLDEISAILVSELGGEYKIYYTVMEAIAFSKNKLSEIASLFDNDTNAVNRYLYLLTNEYNLVAKSFPLIGNIKRITRYRNKSNLFDFWFRFVRKYRDAYEINEFKSVIKQFDHDFSDYIGRKFEEFVVFLFREKVLRMIDFDRIGRQWGKIPNAPKDKDQYEIDIVALNEEKKEILFCECKWQDRVNALEVVNELSKKAGYVDWNLGKKDESYAVFAKSFSKKIDEFEGKRVYCFDLKDIEKALRK